MPRVLSSSVFALLLSLTLPKYGCLKYFYHIHSLFSCHSVMVYSSFTITSLLSSCHLFSPPLCPLSYCLLSYLNMYFLNIVSYCITHYLVIIYSSFITFYRLTTCSLLSAIFALSLFPMLLKHVLPKSGLR